MAKAELGTKRTCPNCGAKYYDLSRNPIICPRCGTYFDASARRPAIAQPIEDDELEVEVAEGTPEFVPLEVVDEEAGGAAAEDEDIEIEADDEADTFLEEEEEDEDDVTGIIGEVDDEDEEP